MALVERPRRIIVNKRAERKAQVYIGIDFGTTYTKVSYMIAQIFNKIYKFQIWLL